MPPPVDTECSMEGKPPFYQSLMDGEFYGNDPDLQDAGWGDCKTRPDMTTEDIQKLRASYYGMVALMDHHIGRILDELERRSILDDTVIIFTSDHGDYLGDHDLWGKGLPAYEQMQRVPMIVSHPNCETRGKVSHALQSVVDLPATLMSMASLDRATGDQGVDQSPAWINGDTSVRDWAMLEFQPSMGSFSQRTYIEDNHKLVLYARRDYGELYDLANDPDQKTNLFDDPASKQIKDDIIRRFATAEMEKDGQMRPRTAYA